ncbi:MAG: hypothetical protein R3E39_20020 [Anaerolineae bacterium]
MNQTTPDTLAYLWLGLATVTVIALGLLGSMYVRFRNLHKDLELLQQLHNEK